MKKKYEFTDEIRVFKGIPGREVVLHRIRALKDFCTVEALQDHPATDIEQDTKSVDHPTIDYPFPVFIHAGDLGGWVESEANLSQNGLCWVHDNAYLTGNAQVIENAQVFDRAWLNDHALASGEAHVGGQAQMHDFSVAKERASLSGYALLFDNATLSGHAQVTEHSCIYGEAILGDSVIADGHTRVKDRHIFTQYDVPEWHPARARKTQKSFHLASHYLI